MDISAQATAAFNFFAGTTPTEATDLSWVSGYDFVITSITLSAIAGSSSFYVQVTDAEGNGRWGRAVNPSGDGYPQLVVDDVFLVLGPNSGAKVSATSSDGLLSIDGLILQPIGSGIW